MTILEPRQTPIRHFPNTLGRIFARIGRIIADAILPPTCLACRMPMAEPAGLCPRCWTQAGFIERPYCERLGTPFPADYGGELISPAALAAPPAYARARAAARYSDVTRDLIHMLKYGDRMDLVQALGGWMTRAGGELLADADLLGVPYRVVISDKTVAANTFEFKARTAEQAEQLSQDELHKRLGVQA